MVQGAATAELAAEARLTDDRGNAVRGAVVPAQGQGPIPPGTRVTITGRDGVRFTAEPVARLPTPDRP